MAKKTTQKKTATNRAKKAEITKAPSPEEVVTGIAPAPVAAETLPEKLIAPDAEPANVAVAEPVLAEKALKEVRVTPASGLEVLCWSGLSGCEEPAVSSWSITAPCGNNQKRVRSSKGNPCLYRKEKDGVVGLYVRMSYEDLGLTPGAYKFLYMLRVGGSFFSSYENSLVVT